MSDGLYQAYQDATDCDRVNVDIARMVAAEFSVQSTLNGVAQAVVDKVVRIHHDTYLMSPDKKLLCQKRGDITLLVRNFNYPLAMGSPAGSATYHPVSVPFYQPRANIPTPTTATTPTHLPLGTMDTLDSALSMVTTSPLTPVAPRTLTSSSPLLKDTSASESNNSSSTYTTNSTGTASSNSTQSSGETRFPSRYYQRAKLDLDDDGRVKPYIDFSDFYRQINQLSEAQRESLNAEIKPKSNTTTIEPIREESECSSLPDTID